MVGDELISNPIVRKLTFTGSTEVGELLIQQCAGTVKKLSLELGGNAPFIVFDDADIEMAVKSLPLRRQGVPSPRNIGMPARPACAPTASWCRTGSTTPLRSASPKTAGAMKVADGFEPGAGIGPLIDMKAVEKVEAHIADAVKKGAKIVTGGKRAAHQHEGGAAASSSRPC
jgi:succinate-semialdehyde dehydrogenase/glutarate-semialdehyde dehydrogenase